MTAGTPTPLACRDEHRRQLIRDRSLNGVDYVDVHGTHLCVHFLTGIPPEFLPGEKRKHLTPEEKARALRHIVIRGGRRITGITATRFHTDPAGNRFEESCLGIDVDREGDFSSYTLCFVELDEQGQPTGEPMKSLDPRYACVDVTFRTECAAEADCKPDDACAPGAVAGPAISYLARDYATFRQLIFDRLSLVMPDWRERHVPDVGIALVEILAYTADYLSYYQDSVGTEQYLDTARQRISVRRHARLVDYVMHDGCNARVFVHLRVSGEKVELAPRDVFFITRPHGTAAPPVLDTLKLAGLQPGWLAFEPLTDAATLTLYAAHNVIPLYTWGDAECCLPRGATRATLLDETKERHENDQYDPSACEDAPPPEVPKPDESDSRRKGKSKHPQPYGSDHEHYEGCGCPPEPPPPRPPRPLNLEAGDFLLFEELACAGTSFNFDPKHPERGGFDGQTPQPDVDRTHRHVVRLTKVTKGCDALLGNRVLEVEWSREDALPFALCISAVGNAPQCNLVRNLAVARGNIILTDHGLTVADEPLDPIPSRPAVDVCEGVEAPADVTHVPGLYRPVLREGPLTFAEPLAPLAPATILLQQNARAALPAVEARSIPPSIVMDDEGRPLSLFRAEDLREVRFLASSLLKPEPEQHGLRTLRRRLRKAVVELLDQGEVTPKLVGQLEENLRALTEGWSPRPDLLASNGDDTHFVAEVDDAGLAHLRFGDGDAGRGLEAGMAFAATYRAGNGRAGLVGPESITHAVFRRSPVTAIENVRNPLPARGAVDPETIAAVKTFAPSTVRRELQRAVTADDYATLARSLRYPERDARVQAASGRLLWNGSWYVAGVSVDPFGTAVLEPSLQQSITARLQPYRRMGHDLHVGAADAVPIRLELELCVAPHFLRAHVVSAVREVLGSRALPDGRLGFFHPDRLTFGAAVYVSRIVAAVMSVEGVAKVCVKKLQRLDHEVTGNPDLPQGLLKLRPNEIARLDNDGTSPENGILTFSGVRGGR
jgi:hypothetical protein